jgi:hypothetical protein
VADQKIFHSCTVGGPPTVCAGETGEPSRYAPIEEQCLPGRLVGRAGAGQFLDVQDLADVVGGGAEQDGVPVEPQAWLSSRQPGGELVGDVVYQAQVGAQPGWRVEVHEQRGDLGRERYQRRVTRRGQRGDQQSDGRHSLQRPA